MPVPSSDCGKVVFEKERRGAVLGLALRLQKSLGNGNTHCCGLGMPSAGAATPYRAGGGQGGVQERQTSSGNGAWRPIDSLTHYTLHRVPMAHMHAKKPHPKATLQLPGGHRFRLCVHARRACVGGSHPQHGLTTDCLGEGPRHPTKTALPCAKRMHGGGGGHDDRAALRLTGGVWGGGGGGGRACRGAVRPITTRDSQRAGRQKRSPPCAVKPDNPQTYLLGAQWVARAEVLGQRGQTGRGTSDDGRQYKRHAHLQSFPASQPSHPAAATATET
jgi:hypothetical protein